MEFIIEMLCVLGQLDCVWKCKRDGTSAVIGSRGMYYECCMNERERCEWAVNGVSE